MSQFQKNRKPNPIIYSKIMLIILVTVILLLLYSLAGMAKRVFETEKSSQIATARAGATEEKADKLKQDLATLDTPAGVESVLRDKFAVVKEGEEMIVITDEQSKTSTEAQSNKHGKFIQFFINLFK